MRANVNRYMLADVMVYKKRFGLSILPLKAGFYRFFFLKRVAIMLGRQHGTQHFFGSF